MGLNKAVKNINGDEEVISDMRQSKKPILIYGCANHAELVFDYLVEHGLEVEAFVVDSQYYRENAYIRSKRLKDISAFMDNIDSYNIVVGFCDVDKSRFLLNNAPLLKGSFYLLWEPLKLYEWDEEYLNKNWKALRVVYDDLADELSKRILNELISAKLNVSGRKIIDLADNRQYFNELTFCLDSENEIFVDCGAFNGDTIMKYVSFTNGVYRKIYAFEPSSVNLSKLKENIKEVPRVEIIEEGTWSRKGVLEFEENCSASRIIENGSKATVPVPVTTIDEIVGDESVTFIKMDVEGSELESLKGASDTIRNYMPKLAICCYHKKDDIINLYRYIKSFNTDEVEYMFYLRHHSNSVYETVLYAIPKRVNKS